MIIWCVLRLLVLEDIKQDFPCLLMIKQHKTAVTLTLHGLGLIKINTVSANFNSPWPSLIVNN